MNDSLPLWARTLNLLGKPLNSLGFGKLDFDSIERKAIREVGFSDFGDQRFKSAAVAFLESINENPDLHFVGRQLLRELMIERLKTRLKIRKTLAGNSSLKEYIENRTLAATERPVFVVGTPRSGTTLLYSLLALDSNSRGPSFWEVVDPAPPASMQSKPDLDRRINFYEKRLKRLKKLLPTDWQQIHAFTTAQEIEEDFYLLEASFRCPSFALVYGEATSYRDHLYSLGDADILAAYREFADMIKLLMYPHQPHSGRYWLSKSPAHAPFAWAMPRVFPQCVIIHMHRDPSQRIPSLCSLVSKSEKLFCNNEDKRKIADRVLDFNQLSMAGIRRSRAEQINGRATIVDVEYEQLKSKPIETLARIHEEIGLEPSPDFASSVDNWLNTKNARDPKRRGTHQYRATEFGLDPKSLEKMEA